MTSYIEINERIVNEVLDLIFSKLDKEGNCPRAAIKLYTAGGSSKGTLLATCYLSLPSFTKASEGKVESYEITPDTNASATGTAAHFELVDRSDCPVISGSVGPLNSQHLVQLDKTNITAGDYVIIQKLEFSLIGSVKC
jgi:hypothetical protein